MGNCYNPCNTDTYPPTNTHTHIHIYICTQYIYIQYIVKNILYILYIIYTWYIIYIWYKYIIYYILYIYIIYPRFYRFPAPSVSFLEAPTWSPWQDWPLRSFALRGRRWPEEAQMGCDWYDTARCWIWLLCHGHGGFLWGLLCIIMGLYGIIWWYHTRVYLMVI